VSFFVSYPFHFGRGKPCPALLSVIYSIFSVILFCHPEQSEGSFIFGFFKILRYDQNDNKQHLSTNEKSRDFERSRLTVMYLKKYPSECP